MTRKERALTIVHKVNRAIAEHMLTGGCGCRKLAGQYCEQRQTLAEYQRKAVTQWRAS